MKAYVVGGAVRDSLLGLAVTDRDWVVVGETPASMRARGFRPVGRAFPVFLHPDTGEEYALARTERKDGHGHQGFAFAADATVTLEEDLRRRDLTVNAIARDENGVLIDPCGGVADLQQRILRHVSPAFIEDPLRVLRVARFYARFAHLGFRVAPATVALMRDLSRSGELATLSGERIVMEWTKAMATASPQCFFILLSEVDAIAPLWPALFADGGQSAWEATMRRISTGSDVTLRLVASMTHCTDIEALLSRYILPKRQARLCQLFHNYGRRLLAAPPADAADWHHLLQRLDIMRRPDDATDWLQLVQARYHLGDEDALIRRLHAAWRAYTSITTVAADGNNYAKALRTQRCAAITAALA